MAYFWKALELISYLKIWTKHNLILSVPLNISLTGIRLWAPIWPHFYFELRDCLISFSFFVLSQLLIARNVRELFSFNRGISHLNEACRIDDVSRGSLSCSKFSQTTSDRSTVG
jgi:hypothetical protein